ncbi:hypothetical protein [Archangium lansingense]|uniref:Uncharacterized protein n=1 Tax=Archangium lansingense TaxID=2995310 RepID=A0ABT3ZYJ1_9BACT|nr:hypothetical protein [Archangium lansinium]MCY1074089.1 hypothetical protein [Archangium lansinium]
MMKPRDSLKIPLSRSQDSLDTFVTNIMMPEEPKARSILDYYVYSKADPRRYARHGVPVPVVSDSIKLENKYISDFASLGSNEQIILNKVMVSNTPLTVIVATVGAGKTTLCKFIQCKLEAVTVPETDLHPLQIYVDFNDLKPEVMHKSTNDKEIEEVFYEHLVNELCFYISKVCSVDQEVEHIWNDALKDPPPRTLGSEFRRVVVALRENGLDSWKFKKKNAGSDHEAVMEGRRALRAEFKKDKRRFCGYLCELISHLRHKYYAGNRWGVIVYIDNIDQFSVHAQRVIRPGLFPILMAADVRSLVMMRESTWSMTNNDAFTTPIDSIPHTGPNPCKAVAERLQVAKVIPPEEHGVRFEDPSQWKAHVDMVLDAVSSESRVSECLDRLSGFSIRKAFVLAQHLLLSFEHPPKYEHLWKHHLKRMMISQGKPAGYQWKERCVVDNLFQIHDDVAGSPLLKVRLLLALSRTKKQVMRLVELNEVLRWFGYESDAIRVALNELMHWRKRIVWADSVLCFPSDAAFLAGMQSRVYAATVAKGYLLLARDLDYMTEVAMDTDVPDFTLSEEPHQGRSPPARLLLEAQLRFMQWLRQTDEDEMAFFLKAHSLDEYKRFYGDGKLLVCNFLPECLGEFEKRVGGLLDPKAERLREELVNFKLLVDSPLEMSPKLSALL